MPEVKVEVYCAGCGQGLCGQTQVKRGSDFYVTPCDACIENAKQEGFEAGKEEGIRETEAQRIPNEAV